MKILYFADIRFPLERANGIQTMETCHALARRGHDVLLAVRPDTHSPPRDPFTYYGVTRIDRLVIVRARATGPPMARRLGYLAFAVERTLRAAADVVLTRDLTVASLVLRIPRRPPLVYESHGYAPDVAAALPRLVSTASTPTAAKLARLARREAYVWQRADGYVTITNGLAAALDARFGARRRVVVAPDGARVGVAEDDGGEAGAPAAAGVIVAYAGHLYAWKGVDVLLEALALVPGVAGLVVGGHEREPDLRRLRGLAVHLGIAGRVTFVGQVPPSAVGEHLRRADVLVLPNPASAISTHWTSPLKLFEYMAAGKAIVASNLPALREVLTDNVNALLVSPGDPTALAAGITRAAGDPALRARLGRAARGAVAEYSWDRRAERLEALFTEVIASRQ